MDEEITRHFENARYKKPSFFQTPKAAPHVTDVIGPHLIGKIGEKYRPFGQKHPEMSSKLPGSLRQGCYLEANKGENEIRKSAMLSLRLRFI